MNVTQSAIIELMGHRIAGLQQRRQEIGQLLWSEMIPEVQRYLIDASAYSKTAGNPKVRDVLPELRDNPYAHAYFLVDRFRNLLTPVVTRVAISRQFKKTLDPNGISFRKVKSMWDFLEREKKLGTPLARYFRRLFGKKGREKRQLQEILNLMQDPRARSSFVSQRQPHHEVVTV